MALENARLYETARNLADRDPLTGFFNHRYLHERLAEEVVRAVRTHRPLSVVMLDLDDFKLVNDTLRPPVRRRRPGPRRGADRGRRCARPTSPARYGGDEFALILPETDARRRGAASPTRMLAAFRDSPFVVGRPRCRSRSAASIGIATYPAGRPVRHGPASPSPTWACTTPRPRAATGSGRTSTPRSRPRSSSGRTAAGPASPWRATSPGRLAGRSSAVEWGLSQYGSTGTPGTDSTVRPPLPGRGPGPHARSR